MYSCGTFASPPYASAGGFAWSRGNTTTKNVVFRNNIIYQTTGNTSFGFPYFQSSSTDINDISGSNNLFFGNGTPPTQVANSINSDPLFVNAGVGNFHLQLPISPANGAGATGTPLPIRDHDGLIRPSPPAVGAWEYAAGAAAPQPNPPTNLTIVVN